MTDSQTHGGSEDGQQMVYLYDQATLLYRGAMPAHSDPISGAPMLPANATFLRPPETTQSPHTAARWQNDHWQAVPDHRGSYAVHIATKRVQRVSALGEIGDGYMLVSDDDAHSIIDHPEYWAEKNGQLVALDARGRDDARINTLKDAKRHARDYMLAHTDWMVMRHGDEALLGLPASEEQYSLASYRRYLRDFTAMHDWWALPTLTFEQFKLEQCGNE